MKIFKSQRNTSKNSKNKFYKEMFNGKFRMISSKSSILNDDNEFESINWLAGKTWWSTHDYWIIEFTFNFILDSGYHPKYFFQESNNFYASERGEKHSYTRVLSDALELKLLTMLLKQNIFVQLKTGTFEVLNDKNGLITIGNHSDEGNLEQMSFLNILPKFRHNWEYSSVASMTMLFN